MGLLNPEIRVPFQGEHCVLMTDATGCVARACVNLDSLSNQCRVDIRRKEGSLVAYPIGIPPFQFEWSTGDTTRSIVPSDSGEYCVTITSSTGCMATSCIQWTPDGNPNTCHTDIVVSPGGISTLILTAEVSGEAPYRYSWSTGEMTSSIAVETSGRYCVKTEDANGCVSGDCISVRITTITSNTNMQNSTSALLFSDRDLKETKIRKESDFELKAFPNPGGFQADTCGIW